MLWEGEGESMAFWEQISMSREGDEDNVVEFLQS